MSLRILHVYKDYSPVLGGIENHLRLLGEGLAARGADVTVLVTNTGCRTSVEMKEGVRIIRAARLGSIASTPLSLSFFKRLAASRMDVTHLHFPYPPGEVGYLLLGGSRRLVITYHSDIIRQRLILKLYRPLLLRVLKRADRLIATSPAYVASSPYLSEFAPKCEVIPLGIDAARFAYDRAPEAGGGGAAPVSILFVGRLRYYKGVEYLLKAMTNVPGRLRLVGSGGAEAAYRGLAVDLGIADKVEFLGDVADEQLPAVYRDSDLLVLPSVERSEAFGIVQLEAMAAGLPVVSTELGTGTSFVNVHGRTGFVVPARDSDALATAIRRLVEDPQLRKEMGELGRERVRTHFSGSVMVDKILDLYRRLLSNDG